VKRNELGSSFELQVNIDKATAADMTLPGIAGIRAHGAVPSP